jgi:hypothetical protein
MCAGWNHEADNRPTFAEIKQKLDSMFGDKGSSVAEEVEKVMTIERGMSLDPSGELKTPPPVCVLFLPHHVCTP